MTITRTNRPANTALTNAFLWAFSSLNLLIRLRDGRGPWRYAIATMALWILFSKCMLAQSIPGYPSDNPHRGGQIPTQRFIPLPVPISQNANPLELVRKLRERNAMPTTDAPLTMENLGSIAKSDPSLMNQLKNLNPSQQEQIRSLAQQLAKETWKNGLPKTMDDIPPDLQRQILQNPELMNIAKNIAESMADRNGTEGQETPWNSRDGFANELLRNNPAFFPNQLEPNAQTPKRSTATPDKDTGLESPTSSQAPNNGDASNSRPSDPNRTKQDGTAQEGTAKKSSRSDPKPPNSLSDNSTERSSTQRDLPADPGSEQSNAPSTSPFPKSPSTGPLGKSDSSKQASTSTKAGSQGSAATATPRTFPLPSNDQQLLTEVQRELDEERRRQDMERASAPPVPRQAERRHRARPESTSDLLARKLNELGLAEAIQKIALEAAARDQRSERNAEMTIPTPSIPSGSQQKDAPALASNSNSQSKWKDAKLESTKISKETQSFASWVAKMWNESQKRSTERNSEKAKAAERPTFNPQFQMPELGDIPTLSPWFFVVLVSILLLLVSLWFLPRSRELLARITGSSSANFAMANSQNIEIHGRADAIRVFHWLLENKIRHLESWWTSKRATQHVKNYRVNLSSEFAEAASLYELARYTPEDRDFAPEELQRMRVAVQACTATETLD